MSDISTLEAEAEAKRAKLQDTIGRLQDKLTVSGLVDDFMGQTGMPKLAEGQDMIMGLLRRHPLPLMVAAAGIGFLIHRMGRRRPAPRVTEEDVEVPVLNQGHARVYDPDLPTRHPLADGADPKRVEA